MPNTFKPVIDSLVWRQVPPAPTQHVAGVCLAADLRNDVSRHKYAYQLGSVTVLNRFDLVTKSWSFLVSPALSGGGLAAGGAMSFVPSHGLVGTIAAGATTTSVTLSTALPTAVGVNFLADRSGGGGYGYKLRIIDTTAGRTVERFIVGNSAGTTPTIRVLSSFGFTPSSGARYEILAGRVFMLGAGTVAANSWRSYEVATGTLSSSLSTTNLPATIGTDTTICVLDEQYVPYNHRPGEGLVKGSYGYDTGGEATRSALTATASGVSTLTGQASSGDAVVAANEYRNFQIRIVEDTTTPAAVGQRRIIASHTAGPSAVYTLGSSWTTQPSSSAKFVIENPNLILVRTSGSISTFVYNYTDAAINNGTNSIASNAWSTAYFASGSTHLAGAQWAPSFGIQPDDGRFARHSFIYEFRGNGSTQINMLDIAAAIGGTWTTPIAVEGANFNLTNTTAGCYAPFGNEGRMFYLNIYTASAVNQLWRFDVKNRQLMPFTPTDFLQTGTATVGNRMAAYAAIDGSSVYDTLLLQSHFSTITQEMVVLA